MQMLGKGTPPSIAIGCVMLLAGCLRPASDSALADGLRTPMAEWLSLWPRTVRLRRLCLRCVSWSRPMRRARNKSRRRNTA